MHLFGTLATAAVVSSAVAANVPAGSNYTFVPHPATSSKPQNLTEAVATSTVSSHAAQGTVISAAKVQALIELSQSFKFEVRGGLCAITDMPAEAAVVNWRLVYDIDLESKFRFEICEAQDKGRVVTKIQGQYLYGLAVSYNKTTSDTLEVECDNGGLTRYKVENKKVVETKEVSVKETSVKVYECSNVSKCAQSMCKGDKCRNNLVAKVEGPVYTNATTPAKPKQTGSPVTYKFEECKAQTPTECFCVQTCVEAKCKVEKPVKGPAPAPIPADKVKAVTPAGPTQAAKEPQKPAVTNKPAGGATNGTPVPAHPAPATAGSGRVVVALNVLAGVVAMALFL